SRYQQFRRVLVATLQSFSLHRRSCALINICGRPSWVCLSARPIEALSLLVQPLVQIPKHTRGRAPDVAAAELHGVKVEGEPIPVATFALVVLGRHQESERHLESVIGLVAVEPKRKAWPHAREHGQNAVTERGHVNVKIADRLDKAAAKCDLLLGLAQRGRGRAFVTGINLSTGKRNL